MVYDIEYDGGHPSWNKPQKASFYIDYCNNTIELESRGLLNNSKNISIKKDNIIDVSFDKATSRSAGKTVAGALIGGMLTGGIGLLIGGALGAKKKNLSELFIRIIYNEREFIIALKTGKYTERIYSEINSLFV
jgi:hypothetical protein